MAYLRSSSLFGLVGQQPPKFPFGIGTPRRWGLSGLVGQPKPEFPFRLGIGTPPPKAQPPRRRKNRNLGCATCAHPWLGRLGQTDPALIDMVYGGGTDAYLNPPASTPQFASTGYNMPDVSSSGVILPGASSIPIFGPQTAPLTAGASQPQTAYVPGGGFTLGPTGVSSGLYTAQQATALMAGVPVSSLPAPSAPGSLSNYLPYIVLGGGALILVAALSKRR